MLIHTIKIRRNLLAAVVAMLAHGAYSATTGGIEEVTVTAEKREESLINTTIAITALSSDALAAKGITDFSGVAAATPSITATPYPSSNNTLILFMRGQGSGNPMEITQDGAVGLYIDGFYISRPQASTFDLADVERVEVLRGPQGTLYGRNTTGGAVNIISKKPSGEFALKQDFTFGSYNRFRSMTTVDLPKFGDLSTKFSYLRSSKDGYVKNAGSSNDFGDEKQNAGRVSVRWEPRGDTTVDYALELGKLQSTPVYYQSTALNGMPLAADGTPYYAADHRMSRTYRAVDLPMSDADYQAHGLTVAWDADDNLTLKSLTSYRDLNSYIYQDYVEIFFVPYTTIDTVISHQFTQELQAIGSALDGRVKYVAGLYYFHESGSHREIIASALDRFVAAESTSEAIYGQGTWTPSILDGRFDITLGLRETRDDRKAERNFRDVTGVPLETGDPKNDGRYSRFNPALTLAYRWSDDLNTYAKASTGYRAGGSSEAAALGRFNTTFKPEEVTSYELGLKSYWLDRRIRFNAAAFYSKLKDMQIAFTRSSDSPSFTQAYNAGRATIRGIETDLTLQPIDDLTFMLDYSFLSTDINKVEVLPDTIFSEAFPVNSGTNISNLFRVPYAPKNSFNLSTDYTFWHFNGGDLSTHLDYRWTDAYYVTVTSGAAIPNSDLWKIGSHALLDARMNLNLDLPRGDKVNLGVWGKNLGNSHYPAFITALGSPLPDVGYSNRATAWAEPPTYGVDISYAY